MHRLVEQIVADSGYPHAIVSIAVVDDPTIHELNRQYLQHDYPTDVLSFPLEQTDDRLEGEVVVSADTAAQQAEEVGWPAADELLLYVIHGTLHLVGHRDKEADDVVAMRRAERHYLKQAGITVPAEDQRWKSLDEEHATPPDRQPLGGL